MMPSSWGKIENLLESGNNQKFYDFIKREATNNQFTYIDDIQKLRLILIGLPCENRYEIFNLSKVQTILNNFNAKEIVELYEMFPPEDSWQFLKSELVESRLKTFLLSNFDHENIISYFPVEMRDSVSTYLNDNLARPLFFMNPAYGLNQNLAPDVEISQSKGLRPRG